jgi:hypothetical protein
MYANIIVAGKKIRAKTFRFALVYTTLVPVGRITLSSSAVTSTTRVGSKGIKK